MGDDVAIIPLNLAMLWAVAFDDLPHDVLQGPDVRYYCNFVNVNAVLFAAHWAGHRYLRRCVYDEMPHLFEH